MKAKKDVAVPAVVAPVRRRLGDIVEGTQEMKTLALLTGHTYDYKEAQTLDGGKKFKCDLCGGIGKNLHLLVDETGKEIKVGNRCLGYPGLKVNGQPVKSGKKGRKPKEVAPKVQAQVEAQGKTSKKGQAKVTVARDQKAEKLVTAAVKKTGMTPKQVNVKKESGTKERDKKIDELLSDI